MGDLLRRFVGWSRNGRICELYERERVRRCADGGFLYGSAFLAHAVVCLAIGIPLWITGARRVEPTASKAPTWNVSNTPTGLAWAF